MIDSGTDNVTVLRARGRRLAKLIRPDGIIEGYDAARLFDLFSVPVTGLGDLHAVLLQLLDRSDCCAVRGAIADAARTRGVRRLAHADPETSDEPTLVETPRRWIALDVDNVQRPNGIAVADLSACAFLAICQLSVEFRDVTCIVQATGSHGIKPGIRLRLWYWLDRPVGGIEAKRWLRNAPVDLVVFGVAQPIYTARPTFCPGYGDPIPARLVKIPGAVGEVHVPKLAMPVSRRPISASGPEANVPPLAAGASRYGNAALMRATARVMHAAAGARHPVLLVEATGLAKLVARNLLTEAAVQSALHGAAETAGLPQKEAADVIAWAFAHSGPQPAGAAR